MYTDTRILTGSIRGFSYSYILGLQRMEFNRRVEAARNGDNPFDDLIISVEHGPVYTLGRHADPGNFLISPERLGALGAEVERIERGGDVTFHGPGQLVVYPIIDLTRYRLGAKRYVELLEESVIRLLADYGIKGETIEGAPGVWVGKGTPRERKICALGVTLKRFITMHGLALNVNTDMRWFNNINPCGFTDKGVTSMSLETGQQIDFDEAERRLTDIMVSLLEECRAAGSHQSDNSPTIDTPR